MGACRCVAPAVGLVSCLMSDCEWRLTLPFFGQASQSIPNVHVQAYGILEVCAGDSTEED